MLISIIMSDLVPATLNLSVTGNIIMKDAVFWDVTPYSGTDFLTCAGTCCLQLQGSRVRCTGESHYSTGGNVTEMAT
jgi:hypothetical protein